MTSPTGITFKKFKPVASMSRETIAYSADVFFNGEKIGSSTNSGRGGQSSFYPEPGKRDAVAAADAWAKEQVLLNEHRPFRINGEIVKADSLEDFCDWQAGYELGRKDLLALIKRNTKTKIVLLNPDKNNGLFTYKAEYNEQNKATLLRDLPNAVFLNPLPAEEALELVLAAQKKQAEKLEAEEYGSPLTEAPAAAKPRKPRP